MTLESQNLLWLRGQVRASALRSVSEALDRLITEARTSGRGERSAIRSVVGTVRLPGDDPGLSTADERLRRLFPAQRGTSAEQHRTKKRTPAARRRSRRG